MEANSFFTRALLLLKDILHSGRVHSNLKELIQIMEDYEGENYFDEAERASLIKVMSSFKYYR